MHSLDAYAQDKLASLRERHLYRALNETLREDGIWVDRNGRRLLSFSCNDYLNLTQHPAIKQAAIAAIELSRGAGHRPQDDLLAARLWRPVPAQVPIHWLQLQVCHCFPDMCVQDRQVGLGQGLARRDGLIIDLQPGAGEKLFCCDLFFGGIPLLMEAGLN